MAVGSARILIVGIVTEFLEALCATNRRLTAQNGACTQLPASMSPCRDAAARVEIRRTDPFRARNMRRGRSALEAQLSALRSAASLSGVCQGRIDPQGPKRTSLWKSPLCVLECSSVGVTIGATFRLLPAIVIGLAARSIRLDASIRPAAAPAR
jgi:hypothetical protein